MSGKRVWCIGGSGLGKSKFVRLVASSTNLSAVEEAMRSALDDVWGMNHLNIQLYFAMDYLERHLNTGYNTIHDRSIIDTMLWGMYPDYNYDPIVRLMEKLEIFDENDIFVIAPTPKFGFYEANDDIWLKDKLRYDYYKNDFIRTYDRTQVTDKEILQHARYKAKSIEKHSKDILTKLNCNVISFEKNEYTGLEGNRYFDWQSEAFGALELILR